MSVIQAFGITQHNGEWAIRQSTVPSWKTPPSLALHHGTSQERGSYLAGGGDVADARRSEETGSMMKAIAVTDQAAGTAGMQLVERPEPKAAINDVIVQVHA